MKHREPETRLTVIEALVRAEQTPLQLAAERGLSLAELLEVADDPRLGEWVRRMCVLYAHHARLLLSQFGGSAAVSLLQLAGKEQSDSPPEVAQKSCVDLLEQLRAVSAGTTTAPTAPSRQTTTSAASSAMTPSPSSGSPGPRGPSEQAILRALEMLDEQHQREPQQPWLNMPPSTDLEPRMNTDEHG